MAEHVGHGNRLTPLRFVVAFGFVSMLADLVYEGARSVTGPFLAVLGASAAAVGLITGLGEASGLVLRLVTGPLADRTGRYWALSIAGYALTVVAVPLLALAGNLGVAAALVVAERFGKAIRTPARDTMLAHASESLGRGRAFGLHQALDQVGAVGGPLLVALAIAWSGGYRLGFAVLAIPAAANLAVLFLVRLRAPDPAAYGRLPAPPGRTQPSTPDTLEGGRLPAQFWRYAVFSAATMLGFATFGVLAYHLQVRHVLAPALIPVVYATAMAVDAVAAVASGWVYDRYGLGGLAALPVLVAVVPWLSFSTSPAVAWAGALVWGAALGIQESTLRAAVADLVPAHRRGTGYGIFSAAYGVAWLAGGAGIGLLYDRAPRDAALGVLAVQVVALLSLLPVLRVRRASSTV